MPRHVQVLDSPFARQTPEKRRADAMALVRGCLVDFGQEADETMVRQQADKIVQSMCRTLGVKYNG
jgi:hypothetical protein